MEMSGIVPAVLAGMSIAAVTGALLSVMLYSFARVSAVQRLGRRPPSGRRRGIQPPPETSPPDVCHPAQSPS